MKPGCVVGGDPIGPELSESRGNEYGSPDSSDFLTILVAGSAGLFFLLLTIVMGKLVQMPPIAAALVPAAVGITGAISIIRPRWIFYGYIALSMLLPTELDALNLETPVMRIYPQDAMFLFLSVLTGIRMLMGKVTFHSLSFNRSVLIYLALGIWATFVGLILSGNSLNNALGDFRRTFVYYLIYFFALALTAKPAEIRFLKYALLAGSIAVIGRGLLQAATGGFVTRRFGDAAHIMNHFEVTFSMLAVFYGIARLTVSRKSSWYWIIPIIAGGMVIILGNFRTCWVGFAGGLFVMLLLLPRHQQFKLVSALCLIGTVAAFGLALLWNYPVAETQSTLGDNLAQKANWREVSSDTNVNWRLDSYRNAIFLWQSRPIIGRGLGEELEFYTATSTGGSMLATGHRVHNSYLWLLMSLGLSGFAVFLAIHGHFIYIVIRHLRNKTFNPEQRTLTIAGFCFYSAIMVSALFDVYLESAPPVTIVSITMALCLLCTRYPQTKYY